MSLDTDLQQPIQQDQPPPTEPESQQAQPPVDEEAKLDADLEEQAIDIPDGDKLVPLSAVTTVRAKYKTAKQEAAEAKRTADEAVEKAERANAALEEAKPWIEAAKSLAAAKQLGIVPEHQPQHQTQLDPKEVADLEAIAKDYDFYKEDGSLNLDKARRVIERERAIATEAAQHAMAPMAQQTAQERSRAMLLIAKQTTKLPDGREVHVDPNALEAIWQRLDPTLTATKEGAQWAFMTAVGWSALTAQKSKQEPSQKAEPPPPPLYTEKAGGRDAPAHIVLNDGDKRVAKDLGMTEKDYAETVAKMPWRR